MCFAVSKENFAFTFGNRSAVYFELKQYEASLKNIEWARQYEFPQEKIQKLIDREEKCRELMDEDYEQNKTLLNEFFRLTYPANPQVPFVVDCLQQKTIDETTKGIFATRDLKAGDILAIEDPFAFGFMVHHLGCCVCMRINKLNLIPSKENGKHFSLFLALSNLKISSFIAYSISYVLLGGVHGKIGEIQVLKPCQQYFHLS